VRMTAVTRALAALAVAMAGLGPHAALTLAAASTPPPDSLCTGYEHGAMPLRWLLDLEDGSGPLAASYALPRLNERAIYCYGGRDLVVTAFDAAPEGLGGAIPYVVSPGWMDTWMSAATFLAATDDEAAPGAPAGPFIAVAVPPSVKPAFDAFRGRWVTVTLHFDDPGAAGCAFADGTGTPGTGEIPTAADLVDLCRQSPVVSSVVAARCPAQPATLAAITAVPEAMRARCFGDRAITFVAHGGSIQNVWLAFGDPPGVGEWDVRDDANGHLSFFVPIALPLPDPAGTPWANRDGVGGPEVWWRITGHFADASATLCTVRDGDLLQGPDFALTITRQPHEAVAFCRNHFTADRLTWLKVPPTDAVPPVGPRTPAGGPGWGWLLLPAGALSFVFVLGHGRRRTPSGVRR
jgi:hypothetical protein